MDGDAVLQAMIARLQAVGRSGLADVAAAAAPLVEEALRATARAGQTPYGESWPEKKAGGAPLERAADHITAKAAGPTVRVYLTGPDVYHHFGTARVPKRQVIPEGPTPPSVAKAVAKAADKAFERLVGGR